MVAQTRSPSVDPRQEASGGLLAFGRRLRACYSALQGERQGTKGGWETSLTDNGARGIFRTTKPGAMSGPIRRSEVGSRRTALLGQAAKAASERNRAVIT